MKKKDNFKYDGSVELKVKRIQVFSFSKLAVPFYWVEDVGGYIHQYGGSIIGRLDEIEDPILAAREERSFINNMAHPFEKGESLTSYEFATATHKMVADSGIFDGRVLVDVFINSKGERRYCVGGSDFIYRKVGDKYALLLDGVELEKMNRSVA